MFKKILFWGITSLLIATALISGALYKFGWITEDQWLSLALIPAGIVFLLFISVVILSKISKITPSWGIFAGLLVGLVAGYVFHIWGEDPIRNFLLINIIQPVGTIFLRSLYMVIVPLVAGSLLVGVVNLGSGDLLKKLGWKVALFYMSTTFCAILIGQSLINIAKPGVGISQELRDQMVESSKNQVESLKEKSSLVGKSLWPGIVDKIIPKNILREYGNTNMLAIILVSLLFGVALMSLGNGPPKEAFIGFFSTLSEVSVQVIGWIMKIAPYAVGALILNIVAHLGLEPLKKVLWYFLIVVFALLVQLFLTYGVIIKTIIKVPFFQFYKKAIPIFLTAFSTSSSAATMPVTIRTLEKDFGVPDSITTFSVPIGVTVNMDGTALFEVMAAIFIAQVFGVDLSLMEHFTLVFLVLVTSIGVAGVPGGSLPILMAAMASLGIPAEGIALILGVDRVLDMCRTVTNVTGDSVAALFLARTEGHKLNFT